MPLQSETELRRPLADTEIKEGVAVKVAQAAFDAVYDAVMARMNSSGGRLYGRAYPSFKGSGNIHLEYFLDWRGEVAPPDDKRDRVEDNHPFSMSAGEPADTDVLETVDVAVTIPETPPNVFRKETGQPIPVAMNSGGKITEKRVKYQPRRK
jgi:hypothetical protein